MFTLHDSSGKEMRKTLIAKLIIISSVQINPAVWGRKYEKKETVLNVEGFEIPIRQGFYRTQDHRDFPWEYNFDKEDQYVKSVYLKRIEMILRKMVKIKKTKEESKHDFRLRISNQVLCKLELLKSLEDEKK